jgi:UDP-N-acetylglucosamine transferase subunit ALG13
LIFATLGTHHDPFPRLIEGLEALSGWRLIVQHGHSPAPLHAAEKSAFLPVADMVERIGAADVVVTHAGVGSILTCLRYGKTPLVVPRQHRLGEHVDDHQVELTRALAEDGKVIPVWDIATLPELVALAPPPATSNDEANADFHRAVREALQPDGRRSRRFRRSRDSVPLAS